MRTLVLIAMTAVMVAVFASAVHAVELEAGATFDGGICWEQDGTEGIASFDGQCITPADYDEIFSYENLAATESLNPDGGNVADLYGITADSPKASVRVRVFQGVTQPTFAEYVTDAHQVAL